MYYYKENKKNIEKYEVSFDSEKLKELRSEIIEKCSKITHKCEIVIAPFGKYFKDEHIKSLKYEKLRSYTIEDFYGDFEYDEYKIEYLYYTFPKLVDLIDKLINGYISVIDEIFNPIIDEIPNKEKILLEEQNKLIDSLSKKKNGDIDKELDLLKESQKKLKEYVEEKKLNKNQVSEDEYYPKVQCLITLEFIATIDKQIIVDAFEFFNGNTEKIKQYVKR